MAVRASTEFFKWLFHRELAPGKDILPTQPDKVLDDQQFILDAEQMLISDSFTPRSNTSSSFGTKGEWVVMPKDTCQSVVSTVATELGSAVVLAWVDSAVDAELRIRTFTGSPFFLTQRGSVTITINASHTSKIWRGFGGLDVPTNKVPTMVRLETRIPEGSAEVFVAGFGMFCDES